MRLLLAVELATSVNAAIGDLIAPLRESAPELAWIPSEKRQLTLKFLGEVVAGRADRLARTTSGVARRHREFAMQVGGIGAFLTFRRARVVWIGVGHEPRLEILQHDLELAFVGEGFGVEGRVFRPHLPLARARAALDQERMRQFARIARGIDLTATSDVAEITLFESALALEGARYRRLHAAKLGEATGGI